MEKKTFDIKSIESPGFLKQLNIKELQALCDDIRDYIIENVSHTGGHLASNLGTVEAIVAMHYVFDSPKDKFLFDVSHQCYTHKILTGRASKFDGLRKKEGISGFANYNESEHDVYESGHSSTSISYASGLLEAKEVNDSIGEVIAFVGDGSIQNGIAFEGLNYIGSQKDQKLILIINDNEMSISKNVGRLAKSFSKIRIRKTYRLVKRVTPSFVKAIFRRLVGSVRTFVYGRNVFTSMGYKYFGPIDGHNLKEMIRYFEFAKNFNESIILHLNTIKGKGYKYSENDKSGKWHGVGAFDIESGNELKVIDDNKISWSKGISLILEEFLRDKDNIRLISPATLVGSEMTNLVDAYKDKVIDVGINEEHALIMASSMSRNGIVPFVSIYSTFLQRAYDYLNIDIARSNNHVILLIDRAGIIGGDGSTHQGIFDVSYLSSLPNFIICMPSNLQEAYSLIEFSYKVNAPIAIRYPKLLTEKIEYLNEERIIIEKPEWKVLNDIKNLNIITYGEYINELKEDIDKLNVGFINALFIKPLDKGLIEKLNNTKVIVLEEVIENGSLASMLMQYVNEKELNIKMKSLSIKDKYPDLGSREELKEELGLSKNQIIEYIKKML